MTKFPTIKELSGLLKILKSDIGDEYRAHEDEDKPGMQVTIGHNPNTGDWSYQTGDNSYTGSCYSYPNWAVIYLYRRSDTRDLARYAISELKDLACI